MPGQPEYDRLRQSWNSTARQEPALVVAAGSAGDVAAAVRFAAEHGRRVAVQSTGHGAAGTLGADVVLVDTRRLDEVRVDPARQTASAGAGATWGTLTRAAEPAGLVGLAGTALDVGVAGYTLHGGVGWLSRVHGLASASLLRVDYVDAQGEPRHTDETHDPEALWAFRGGGGAGIATRLELRLWPHARFYGGARFWSMEHAPRVQERWLSWTAHLPESITSMLWLFQAPDVPGMPGPLRGRSVIALGACGSVPDHDRGRIESLLVQLPEPLLDSFAQRSPGELGEIQSAPPAPVPARGDGRLLARPDPATVAEIARASGIGQGGPLLFIELRHLGGRAARPGAAGALTALPGEFLLVASGLAATDEHAGAVDATFRKLAEAAAPVDLARSVAAFRGGQTDAPDALDPASRERLRALRRARDPQGRLHRPRELAA